MSQHVHYDIEGIEKELRQQAERALAAARETATSDDKRAEVYAQQKLVETHIIIAKTVVQLLNAGISHERVDEIIARYCGFMTRGLLESAIDPLRFRAIMIQAINGDIQPTASATVKFKSVQVGRA